MSFNIKSFFTNKNKKTFRSFFLIAGLISFAVACSKVNFSQQTSPGCVSVNNQCKYDYSIYASGGLVDIVFVDDNSGSMSFEQVNMANHFPNFLQKLDDRLLDYRIGIITTDIASSDNPPRAINQNGALQNGKLIEFQSGMKYIEPNTPDKNNLFIQTIKRQETIQCDQFLLAAIQNHVDRNSSQFQTDYLNNCPSGDERAIYAANSLVSNDAGEFIRPEAHLAIVILSDENNRSFGNTVAGSPFALETQDLPQSLIDLVQQKYAGKPKSLSVHSVVVPTGDSSCLNVQNNQIPGFINGQYGTNYELLSDMTSGYKGSVCASDWGAQMGEIGAAIVAQVQSFKLHCASPNNLQVTYAPGSAQNSYTLDGDHIIFARPLDPSSQTRFSYSCL